MTIELTQKELDAMWNFLDVAFVKRQFVTKTSSVQMKLLMHLENAYEQFHRIYIENLYTCLMGMYQRGAYFREEMFVLIEDRKTHSMSRTEMEIMKRFIKGEKITEADIRPIFLQEYVGKENIEAALNDLI